MRIMNILVVHEVNWFKKVVYEFHDFAENLSLLGYRVICVDFEEGWERESFFDLGHLGIRVYQNVSRASKNSTVELRRPGLIKLPLLDRLTSILTHYFAIKKIIRSESIDAILLYSVPTNGIPVVLLGRRNKIPVIFRSIDKLHRLRHKVFRWPVFFSEKIVYPRVDRILALTPKLADYVCQLGAEREKVTLLLPGINRELFRPAPRDAQLMERWSLEEDDRIIIFVGTFFEFSGLDFFIENFPLLLQDLPQARLLLVGDGPLRKKIERMAGALGISDRITITGFQSYELVPRFINLAQVAINPFRLVDATRDIIPTKLLQYLACQVPVVCTPLPGIQSVLAGEDCGIVYSDSTDFMSRVRKLLMDEEKRKSLGEKGHKYVEKNHDWNILKKRLETLIQQEIERKGTRT
ncbi:hypothetical protein HKBW3S25_00301 [Candidatus Hakubella thermalkaliphila]|uniref:Uncharacterized protein n=2 Tax=Candidatus Hakubella thermalkaliphila TaxID=2754717 RepID=A0A6V8NXX9_9ACTN|nr:hypothetical protein HKBW3S25_00301 [Candidatus Hakubella thermalkaliphila]